METFEKVIDKQIIVTIVPPPAEVSELDEYRELALRSCKPLERVVTDAKLLRQTLIAAVAMGDLIDLCKKVVVYGQGLDYPKYGEAAGVVLDAVEAVYNTVMLNDRPYDPLPPVEVAVNPVLLHAVLGIYGEAGEMFAALLHQINGEELDVQNLEEEGGDACWYLLALYVKEVMKLGGGGPSTMLRMNVAKLIARYPQLFTLEASQARDVEREQEAMEIARSGASYEEIAAYVADSVRMSRAAA